MRFRPIALTMRIPIRLNFSELPYLLCVGTMVPPLFAETDEERSPGRTRATIPFATPWAVIAPSSHSGRETIAPSFLCSVLENLTDVLTPERRVLAQDILDARFRRRG